MLYGEEAIEGAKTERRNREEIEGGDKLAMIIEKCQPLTGPPFDASTPESSKVAGDCGLGNVESQLEKFTVDAWCSPAWILGFHPPDKIADFLSDSRAPAFAGPPSPKETEGVAMPRDNRFRSYQDKSISPT